MLRLDVHVFVCVKKKHKSITVVRNCIYWEMKLFEKSLGAWNFSKGTLKNIFSHFFMHSGFFSFHFRLLLFLNFYLRNPLLLNKFPLLVVFFGALIVLSFLPLQKPIFFPLFWPLPLLLHYHYFCTTHYFCSGSGKVVSSGKKVVLPAVFMCCKIINVMSKTN